jgi:hypothetical protein
MGPARAISGHVFRADGKHQAVWRAKYRLSDGRQVQKTIGRVWTERGRPRAGYFTKRTAQAWLRDVLEQAERGVLPGMVRTRHTFADAADEYLRYLTDDRQRKPSSVLGSRPYCSTLTRTALLFRTDRSSAIAALGARAVRRMRQSRTSASADELLNLRRVPCAGRVEQLRRDRRGWEAVRRRGRSHVIGLRYAASGAVAVGR